MTDVRDFRGFDGAKPREADPGNTPGARDAFGRWQRGGPSPNPAGRAPKLRELEIAEAGARGCPAEQWEAVVRRLVDMALKGEPREAVPAARLLAQVRGAIGREEPSQAIEAGESMAGLLSLPGKAEEISKLMDAVFATAPPGKP